MQHSVFVGDKSIFSDWLKEEGWRDDKFDGFPVFKSKSSRCAVFGLGTRYTALIAVVVGMFINFVACGSQFYKSSLKDDTRTATSNDAAANDPTSPTFGLHSPGGWFKLPIHFQFSSELSASQKSGLVAAMHIWETAVGKPLFVLDGIQQGVTGDSFKDLYSSLQDDINGHYLDDNWAKTGKKNEVLATTIWNNERGDASKIQTADIRFNSDHYVIGDALAATIASEGDREVVDMTTLATHELGHFLGLTHDPPQPDLPVNDPYSIMNPSVYIGKGLANRRLSRGDLQRIQKIYGCAGDSCDIEKTLEKIDEMSRAETDAKDRAPTMQDTAALREKTP